MKNYYVLSNGRVKRDQNTIWIETEAGEKKPIPVEDVESLYLYGEVDINTKLLNFLSQKKIPLHVFNYYGFYSGSYYPREYLHSGYLLVRQVAAYTSTSERLDIARELTIGAAHSIQLNIRYYLGRRESAGETRPPVRAEGAQQGVPTDEDAERMVDAAAEEPIYVAASDDDSLEDSAAPHPLRECSQSIARLAANYPAIHDIDIMRGTEGKIREQYYNGWRHMITGEWAFEKRVKRPPDNEVNALISFGNTMLYTVCLSEIYRTQLTPTISYLHEPGSRRFSLALDLSEIFKPLLVDRAIFRLLNSGQLKDKDFARDMNSCYLAESGRRTFLQSFEERLATTIFHRRLKRHVSYRHLIRLECYRLVRHLTGVEPYQAFKAWW